MKRVLLSILMLFVATSVYALPTGYDWVDADYWSLTDLSTTQGTFHLTYQNPGASYQSAFGLYTVNEAGDEVVAKHEVFSASQAPAFNSYGTSLTSASVWFKNVDSVWQISDSENGIYSDFGTVFGFYFDVYTDGVDDPDVDDVSYSWYSYVQFNSNGQLIEHIFTAFDSDLNTTIWLEDRASGYQEGDPLDMMVSTNDVAPVPEPATLLLLGSGLVGLAFLKRRKA